MAETQEEAVKIKTSTPGIHLANGKTMDDLEIIPNPANEGKQLPKPTLQAGAQPAVTDVQPNASEQQPKDAQPAAATDPEISDDEFNKILAKKSGGKYKSLEELNPPAQPTAEEVEAQKNQRKTAAHLWAIESGKTTKEKYDQAIKESGRTDRDIALSVFTKSLKEDDKNITTEEAEEIFNDTFHQDKEEDSRLRKNGDNQIKKMADAYRKENISFLDEIEPEYDQVVATQNQYQAYKGRIKELGEKIPKVMSIEMPYENVDGTKVTLTQTFDVDDTVIKKVLDEVRGQNFFTVKNVTTNGKITDKELDAEITSRIKAATYDAAIKSMYAAGLKKGEELAVVIMGNKRNQQQTLNDGVQAIAQPAGKPNEYTGLKKAMAEQNR